MSLVNVSNAAIAIKKCVCPECEKEVYELDDIGLELERCPHCEYEFDDELEQVDGIELYIFVDPVTGMLKGATEEELENEIRARL